VTVSQPRPDMSSDPADNQGRNTLPYHCTGTAVTSLNTFYHIKSIWAV